MCVEQYYDPTDEVCVCVCVCVCVEQYYDPTDGVYVCVCVWSSSTIVLGRFIL